jgi:hypothetical protein
MLAHEIGILRALTPVPGIPQLSKLAWEAVSVADVILMCLQEALASGTGLWD